MKIELLTDSSERGQQVLLSSPVNAKEYGVT